MPVGCPLRCWSRRHPRMPSQLRGQPVRRVTARPATRLDRDSPQVVTGQLEVRQSGDRASDLGEELAVEGNVCAVAGIPVAAHRMYPLRLTRAEIPGQPLLGRTDPLVKSVAAG